MIKLESITLNNIRRFSQDVTIDIKDGATIFLAPNGTGKTAIFEAIELALTKEIRRFDTKKDSYKYNPVIRDGCDDANIKLNFGNDGFYSVTLEKKEEEPFFEGDHSTLFGDTSIKDIPYLFHMTHLLNQSQKNWFVHINEKKAGEQLNHLPIGKDAIEANSRIVGAKRASNQFRRKAEADYEASKQKQAGWLQLIDDRNKQLVNRDNPLKSLDQLLEEIKSIENIGIGRDVPLNTEALKDLVVQVSSLIEQIIEEINQEANTFSTIKFIPNEYEDLQKQLIYKKEVLELAISNKDSKKKQLEQQNHATLIEENKGKNLRKDLSALENINDKSQLLNQLEIKSNQLNQALQEASKASGSYVAIRTKLQSELQDSEKFKIKHLELDAYKKRTIKDIETTGLMQQSLEDWSKYLLKIENNEGSVRLISKRIASLQKELSIAVTKQSELGEVCQQATDQFNRINTASSHIHEAVISISQHLPKEQDNCPVCNVLHGHSKLQEKITAAMNAMNPMLAPAQKKMEAAEHELQMLNDNISKINIEITKNNVELEEVQKEIVILNSYIKEFNAGLFSDCHDIEQCKTYADKKLTDLKSQLSQIVHDRTLLASEPSEDEIEKIRIKTRRLGENISRNTIEIEEIKSNLLNTKLQIEPLKLALSDHQKLLDNKEIGLLIHKKEDEIIANNLSVNEHRILKQKIVKDLIESKEHINIHEKALITTKQAIETCIEQWSIIIKERKPSMAEFKRIVGKNESKLSSLITKKNKLSGINLQLSRWDSMDTLKKVNTEIDNTRKELSEDDHTKLLEQEVKDAQEYFDDILEKHNTLEKLSINLDNELKDNKKHIQRFTPLRNLLLNKIVVDPRFSEVETSIRQFRRNQQASTTTRIHDEDVIVSHIASEAQLTDLQLTFMLSMAKAHRWSNWKALLLDDPTQHHDLIHSAGVFDLLRDYIVDDGFQILLSTHDSLQANFFKRKLQNDGIPVQIWELGATERGVEANPI